MMTALDMNISSFDADLNAPPHRVPVHPPVATRPQVLTIVFRSPDAVS
jgi:hypothetical protein